MDVSRPWGAVPGRKTPFYPDALHVSDTIFRLLLIQSPSNSSTLRSNDCARVHTGCFQALGSRTWRKTPFYPDALHLSDTVFRLLLIQSPSNSSTSRSNDCARVDTGYASPNIRPTTDYPRLPTWPHPTMLHTLPCIWSTFLCCHCCLKAFLVDQPLPMCNLHSIKLKKQGCVKMFLPKIRANVGMVQCASEGHGKPTGGKTVGTRRRAGPCKEGGQPVQT